VLNAGAATLASFGFLLLGEVVIRLMTPGPDEG